METWTALPDVPIPESGPLGLRFRERGCATLREAARFLHDLPYGRNSNRSDFHLVISEGRGTCSTKHALLAALAQELGIEIALTLGVYEMCEANTPGVGIVLDRHGLSAIPEAHTYLRFDGRRVDVTRSGIQPVAKIDFIREEEIRPDQIGAYKSSLHQRFIREWLSAHPELSPLTAEALWTVREACISAISDS